LWFAGIHAILKESKKHTTMDFDTDFWSEIQDSAGEIFDIPELLDEKDFDFDGYLAANYDYA